MVADGEQQFAIAEQRQRTAELQAAEAQAPAAAGIEFQAGVGVKQGFPLQVAR
jgi:hypothetical protein